MKRSILQSHIFKFFLLVVFLLGYQISFCQTEVDPDIPDFLNRSTNKEEFLIRRAEAIGAKRGIEVGKPFNPVDRINAIKLMEQQIERVSANKNNSTTSLLGAWTEIGPNPIPNGQVVSGAQLPVSGRVISIAVHPTNPDIVYVGTAQGGLFRTIDGGISWIPLLDNALSLAIGAVVICPSQPETIYVGTGEHNFSADSYFGAGLYRIDNASSASPIISAPIGSTQFNGRGIGKIIVHPTNPAIIFVASTSGVGGIISTTPGTLPSRGVFRSTDATSATPTFTQIGVLASPNNNLSIRDIAIDPNDPNIMLANVVSGGGGIYRSINALATTPTWTQVFNFPSGTAGTSNLTAEFAAIHPSGDVNATFYAAVGNNTAGTGTGRILKSTDGGATFTQINASTFCNPQCFYNICIAVDPSNVNNVYVGGTGNNFTFIRSVDGGSTFTASQANLHTDSHVIAIAPSSPTTVYFGSDGGIYKSTNSAGTWASLNNTTFRATQFMGIAVHPTDANFTIGGTQDNGTEYRRPDGTWTRADFGDGGYAVIDQSALNTTTVNMYHTYFNATTLTGYGYIGTTAAATEGNWAFRGCNGSAANGITCATVINFYAPLERGPGTPNTVYYGADRLYRTNNLGVNHTAVSQTFTSPISAIGISPQNDNVRIIGRNDGGIFGTTTGVTPLVDLDPTNTVPNNGIARAIIDPTDINKAYVTISAFNLVNVWRTSNLNATPPTWTSVIGTGGTALPLIPINAFLVDPANAKILYAGTDIGMYVSTDEGVSWNPYGTGLPRVAVFGIAKAPNGVIRIATHGRGMWENAGVVLPVKWIAVTGNINSQKQAVINWKVQEENVAKYEIEKSTNGNLFEKIGSVSCKGDGENDYIFTELKVLSGTAFYRIKQIDKDGKSAYSIYIKLMADRSSIINIFPDPFKDNITISIGSDLLNTNVVLTDINGKQLQIFNLKQLSQSLNMSAYASGIYIFKFKNGRAIKMIKQ